MATLIQKIHDLVNLATDKGFTNYHSPSQIDGVVDSVQMTLFRQLNERVKKDKSAARYLLPFEVKTSITMTNNVGTVPSNFEQEIEAWSGNATGTTKPIIIKEETQFRKRRRTTDDPIDTMADRVNTAIIYYDSGKKIEVEQQVTPVNLRYYRRPVEPVYGTTLANGQLIYFESATTDVEFSALLHDKIVEDSLAILGISLREVLVYQAGRKEEPKAASL